MRFIKIVSPIEILAVPEITREDLVKVKERYFDAIIDLDNFSFYNGSENRWDKINETQNQNRV